MAIDDNTLYGLTGAQVKDLASNVQSKAEIGSVLSEQSAIEYVGTNNIVDDAITTDKIADGAVTAGKIDFTSFKNVPSVSRQVQMGYGSKCVMVRIGNIVMVSDTNIPSQAIPSGGNTLAETVPSGYKPRSGTIGVVNGAAVDGAGTGAVMSWVIQPTGAMELFSSATINTSTRICMTGVWITSDDWPS